MRASVSQRRSDRKVDCALVAKVSFDQRVTATVVLVYCVNVPLQLLGRTIRELFANAHLAAAVVEQFLAGNH